MPGTNRNKALARRWQEPEELRPLAHDVTVEAHLREFRHGECSLPAALARCIAALVAERNDLLAEVDRLLT